MAEFLRLKISDDLWLSACAECREVIAFGPNAESFQATEANHECPASNPDLAERTT